MLGLALRLGALPAHSNTRDQTIIGAVRYVHLCTRACVSAFTYNPDEASKLMLTCADVVAPGVHVSIRGDSTPTPKCGKSSPPVHATLVLLFTSTSRFSRFAVRFAMNWASRTQDNFFLVRARTRNATFDFWTMVITCVGGGEWGRLGRSSVLG